MAKKTTSFLCSKCQAPSVKWTGSCNRCGEWGSVEEVGSVVSAAKATDLLSLRSFDGAQAVPVPTGIGECDRVLGGGLVPGSITLLSGEPGIGKSTLSLQIALSVANSGSSVVVVTGEEAPGQVAARASRLGEIPASLSVIDDTSIDVIDATLRLSRPQLVVVDSIQTLTVPEVDGTPGSVVQVRAAAHRLTELAKSTDISVVIIGHVTKDGTLAGPRLLEHVVDTVVSFTGDRHHDLRFLRTSKHRFGPTTDVGLFEMTGSGLQGVEDPSARFLADRCVGAPGSIVVPALDERRPVLAELQALTSPNGDRPPQLSGQGIGQGRLKLVAAVLEQRAGVKLFGNDIFASAAGGADVKDPGSDLGLALAIRSAVTGRAYAPDLVACGEIGLAGEVRSVAQLDRRLQEAHRLGFRRAIVPASAPDGPTGLQLIRVSTLAEAVGAVERVSV